MPVRVASRRWPRRRSDAGSVTTTSSCPSFARWSPGSRCSAGGAVAAAGTIARPAAAGPAAGHAVRAGEPRAADLSAPQPRCWLRAPVADAQGLVRPDHLGRGVGSLYAGQQDLGQAHQPCPAHVLRDVPHAMDCGDTVVAPKIRPAVVFRKVTNGFRSSRAPPSTPVIDPSPGPPV